MMLMVAMLRVPPTSTFEKRQIQKEKEKKQQALQFENDLGTFKQAAFESDRKKFPKQATTPRGYPRWDGSAAKILLKKDIHENNHKREVVQTDGTIRQIKPSEFQKTSDEYQNFPTDIFRGHIYQEEKAQRARSYWMHKKEENEKRKRVQK